MAAGKWLGSLAIGLAAGVAGTLAMNGYWAAMKRMQTAKEGSALPSEEPTTVKVARDALERIGVRHPSRRTREIGGNIVHWGYGSSVGGMAGLIDGLGVPLYWGGGQLLGAGLWAAGDLWLLYQLGYARHPREYPTRVHVEALGAHLVYGASVWAAMATMKKLAGGREEARARRRAREEEKRYRTAA